MRSEYEESDVFDGGWTPNLSSSVVMPRPWEWGKYVTPLSREGYLEKQSLKDKTRWKRRWVVMQENVLYLFKEKLPANANLYENENLILQRYQHGTIQLDDVATVCTAKEWGPASFQMKLLERKYILRADSKDQMNNWLFEFQRSIANLITVIRSKSLSTSASVTRHIGMARREHRSQSFDCRDHRMFDQLQVQVPFEEYAAIQSTSAVRYSTESASSTRSSFVRSPCTSPNFCPFQLDDVLTEEAALYLPPAQHEGVPVSPATTSFSVPIPVAAPTAIPELQKCISPPPSTTTRRAYVPPHLRAGYVAAPSIPSVESPRLEYAHLLGESAMDGDLKYGFTSLVGKRSSLEDVICCEPTFGPAQSIYALFDGHAGVDAAKYAMNTMPNKLRNHPSFETNWRDACTQVFREIDHEFLQLPRASTGTTASLVVVRGRKLLTANIGDSRAVISIQGQALDIISVQNPGREDERLRIEKAGGWVLEEEELHMNKLHGMDWSDPVIEQKANRVVRWIQIFRVNGELAVSRAIGDVDYKRPNECNSWLYPEEHNRAMFTDSLVIPDPEFEEFEITPEIEFFVLACDGLWDTITSQEAVTHVREKLLLNWSMRDISYSLADLAIRSGSLDNGLNCQRIMMEQFLQEIADTISKPLRALELAHLYERVRRSLPVYPDVMLEEKISHSQEEMNYSNEPIRQVLGLFSMIEILKRNGSNGSCDQSIWTQLLEIQSSMQQYRNRSIFDEALGFILHIHATQASSLHNLQTPTSILYESAYVHAIYLECLVYDSPVPEELNPSRIALSMRDALPASQDSWINIVQIYTSSIVNELYKKNDIILKNMPPESLLPSLEAKRGVVETNAGIHTVSIIQSLTAAICSIFNEVPICSSSMYTGIMNVVSWLSVFSDATATSQMVQKVVHDIQPTHVPNILVPLLSCLKQEFPTPYEDDVLRGNKLLFYLTFLSKVGAQNLDTLFYLTLQGIGHNLSPLHQISHRFSRILVHSGSSEMASVYMRRMLQNYPTITSISNIASFLGAMIVKQSTFQDTALLRFCLLEVYEKWKEDPEAHAPLALLLFELLKLVPLDDLSFACIVVEKLLWNEPTMLKKVYDTISISCDAPRRIVLLEWFLRVNNLIQPTTGVFVLSKL